MFFRIIRASTLALATVLASNGATWAQSDQSPIANAIILTVTLNGTLGPALSGSDPAGLDGQSAMVTVTAKESLVPYKTTANSASYHIPAGAIIVDVNGTNYTSTKRSGMTVKLTGKGDFLTFKSSLIIDGFKVTVVDTSSLQAGSWSNTVLQHPAPFSPSPQNLSSPSSKFQYTVFGEKTVLGVTGTISNSDAADAALARLSLRQ
jgi:hypothetical protein